MGSREIFFGALNCGSKMPMQSSRRRQQVALAAIVHQKSCGSKNLVCEFSMSKEFVQRSAEKGDCAVGAACASSVTLARNQFCVRLRKPLPDRLFVFRS